MTDDVRTQDLHGDDWVLVDSLGPDGPAVILNPDGSMMTFPHEQAANFFACLHSVPIGYKPWRVRDVSIDPKH